mgnify:CR=1 FL=1
MMQACPWPVSELITHSGDKILLDQVIGYDHEINAYLKKKMEKKERELFNAIKKMA